ncbi:MAG TPA: SDR family oxidoreductase [Methylomusa anaerophila]|uniref:3-oxoacyl-[acyl-carrier-protein] reductase FabG n=1 Tax=Methylomusa anaerophila TaxID=1930071 RepID=A0A348AN36_9FIRM|nr:SDR family oxidoreductase [Methylomusa anaerophila]BBB92484.1 3-oxoacyl-[acyl-carrier-protein] reductase FabG [Methylomusa anaerophila]HML87664.1 SDR family oxidoreductase [Methylomusa anaerophila]
MKDKIILITGANAGVGKATAKKLAELGATLILACRNQEKGQDARMEIIASTKNANIEVMKLDLASFTSIHAFADEFNGRYEKLDVLINNAGIMQGRGAKTADGLELVMGTNHFGHFLLTMLLFDVLRKSAPSRIVIISSMAHEYANFDANDLQTFIDNPLYSYGNSKLANILFTYELARKLQGTGVTANCLHPGVIDSEFYSHAENEEERLRYEAMKPHMISPEEGALTSVYLASSPEVEGVTGKYFVQCKEASSTPMSYDVQLAKKLWDLSMKVVSLD